MRNLLNIKRKSIIYLVNIPIALIILFGFNSFLYINNQKALLGILTKKEGIRALEISADIDKISFQNKIEKKILACNDIESDYCEDLLVLLIQLKNRIYDYRMILSNIFDLEESSKEVNSFIDYENSADSAIERIFGLSPKNAKQRGVSNVSEYKDEIIKVNLFNKNLFQKNKTITQLNLIIDSVFKDLNGIVTSYKSDGLRVEKLLKRIRIYFIILIILETMIFLSIYKNIEAKNIKYDFINSKKIN